jgi:hypothetical protein
MSGDATKSCPASDALCGVSSGFGSATVISIGDKSTMAIHSMRLLIRGRGMSILPFLAGILRWCGMACKQRVSSKIVAALWTELDAAMNRLYPIMTTRRR